MVIISRLLSKIYIRIHGQTKLSFLLKTCFYYIPSYMFRLLQCAIFRLVLRVCCIQLYVSKDYEILYYRINIWRYM
jgi:hypothetical protein